MKITKKEINENMRWKKNSKHDKFYLCEIKKGETTYIFEFSTHLFDPTFCNRVHATIETKEAFEEKRIGESISTKKEAVNEVYEYLNN